MSSFESLPKDFMPIYLVGMMGSGKSTVGPILSASLRARFIDTDQMIEDENGPISRIFSDLGEDVFRDLEADILEQVREQSSVVIATGGGMPVYRENMNLMLGSGVVVYLKCSIDTLDLRLRTHTNDRPLLTTDVRQSIGRLIDSREDVYARAQIVVDGNLDSPEEIAAIIAQKISEMF